MALFQIVSDLHLETHPSYSHFKLPTTDAPYIALLGDIGHVCDEDLFRFFRELVKHYWLVFFLLGNHDPYQLTLSAAKARLRRFERQTRDLHADSNVGKFVFLDQTRYDLDGTTTILGCTLFSHVPAESKQAVGSSMVDFRDTRDWTVDDHNAAHRSDVEWLNGQVSSIAQAEPQRRVVVFTHHSPTNDERANDPRHRDSVVKPGFVTDLSGEACWTSPNVRMWAFGHTHCACDLVDEATGKKVVQNPKGYWRDPSVDKSVRKEYFEARAMYELPSGRTIAPVAETGELVEEEGGRGRGQGKGGSSTGFWRRVRDFGR